MPFSATEFAILHVLADVLLTFCRNMSHNILQGPIPEAIGKLTALTSLYVSEPLLFDTPLEDKVLAVVCLWKIHIVPFRVLNSFVIRTTEGFHDSNMWLTSTGTSLTTI